MKKNGIFYGSTTGTTADVANRLAQILEVGVDDIYDVAKTAPSAVGDYETLIFGTSTWGSGDLQDDWADYVDGVEQLDLEGKKIALFGCGDETMSDTFCGAVGELYNRLKKTGATFIAPFNVIGYSFDSSEAVRDDGEAVGLLLDEVNHADMTDARMAEWAKIVKEQA